APRSVKLFGISAVVVVLLVVIMMVMSGGQHGPGRHMPGGWPRWLYAALQRYRAKGAPAMTMGPSLRKLALSVHLTCSVRWIGAVVAYLALGVSAATRQDAQTVRAAWVAMEVTGWFVIVPLAVAALLTGFVMSLGTPWGLFRHYWVLITLMLTALSTVVLLLHMPAVSVRADMARQADGTQLARLGGDLFHPGVGLLVLLVITGLNVYKPRGLTPYGWRKQREQR
ncbi:MAG TPA: hypothetical protein VK821_07550, partial [Dehalococcoidia bacterium]|nr:hypothetical protein [Dehalococcoidia bacterium]